jgi:hypothetical protein
LTKAKKAEKDLANANKEHAECDGVWLTWEQTVLVRGG